MSHHINPEVSNRDLGREDALNVHHAEPSVRKGDHADNVKQPSSVRSASTPHNEDELQREIERLRKSIAQTVNERAPPVSYNTQTVYCRLDDDVRLGGDCELSDEKCVCFSPVVCDVDGNGMGVPLSSPLVEYGRKENECFDLLNDREWLPDMLSFAETRRKQLAELEMERDHLLHVVEGLRRENADLSQYKAELDTWREKYDALEVSFLETSKQKGDLDRRYQDALERLARAHKDNAELEDESEKAEHAARDAAKKKDSAERQYRVSLHKIGKLEKEKAALMKERDSLNKKNVSLQEHNDAINAFLAKQEEVELTTADIQKEKDNLHRRYQTTLEALTRLQGEKVGLLKAMAELKKENDKHTHMQSQHAEELAKKTKDLDKALQRLSHANEKATVLYKKYTALKTNHAALIATYEKYSSLFAQREKEHDLLLKAEDDMARMQHTNNKLQEQHNNLEHILANKQEQLIAHNKKAAFDHATLHKKCKALEEQNKDNAQNLAKHYEEHKILEKTRQEKMELKNRNAALRQLNEDKAQALAAQAGMIAQKEHDEQEARRRLMHAESEKAALRQNNAALRRQSDERNRALEERQAATAVRQSEREAALAAAMEAQHVAQKELERAAYTRVPAASAPGAIVSTQGSMPKAVARQRTR